MLAENPHPNSVALLDYAETYNFALLDGRHITPTSWSERNTAGSSLVQARINNKQHVGEIRSIFAHRQPGVRGSTETILAAITWMKYSEHTLPENPDLIWDKVPELGVETWDIDTYVNSLSNELPMIMCLADLHCQVCRGRMIHTEPKLWITATLDRWSTVAVPIDQEDLVFWQRAGLLEPGNRYPKVPRRKFGDA
ncbi:hypothetical protein K438DRAFT_1782899 [Mycena galopus ATCC 62051]|nr:hypothetical protein K438DRAFT_1782899 [Mycena galopus ATCC 62051]